MSPEEFLSSLERRGFRVLFKDGGLWVEPFAKLSRDDRAAIAGVAADESARSVLKRLLHEREQARAKELSPSQAGAIDKIRAEFDATLVDIRTAQPRKPVPDLEPPEPGDQKEPAVSPLADQLPLFGRKTRQTRREPATAAHPVPRAEEPLPRAAVEQNQPAVDKTESSKENAAPQPAGESVPQPDDETRADENGSPPPPDEAAIVPAGTDRSAEAAGVNLTDKPRPLDQPLVPEVIADDNDTGPGPVPAICTICQCRVPDLDEDHCPSCGNLLLPVAAVLDTQPANALAPAPAPCDELEVSVDEVSIGTTDGIRTRSGTELEVTSRSTSAARETVLVADPETERARSEPDIGRDAVSNVAVDRSGRVLLWITFEHAGGTLHLSPSPSTNPAAVRFTVEEGKRLLAGPRSLTRSGLRLSRRAGRLRLGIEFWR